jgi:hypothetical protein
MPVPLIVACWALSLLTALTVGFHWSKRVPHGRTLRAEVARRLRLAVVYAKATLAVLSPTYGRRWDRQREAERRAYVDQLVPIQRRWAAPAPPGECNARPRSGEAAADA